MKRYASPQLLFAGLSVPQIFIADHVPGTILVTGYTLLSPMDKVPCEVSQTTTKVRQANSKIPENTEDCEENKKGEWDRK